MLVPVGLSVEQKSPLLTGDWLTLLDTCRNSVILDPYLKVRLT